MCLAKGRKALAHLARIRHAPHTQNPRAHACLWLSVVVCVRLLVSALVCGCLFICATQLAKHQIGSERQLSSRRLAAAHKAHASYVGILVFLSSGILDDLGGA